MMNRSCCEPMQCCKKVDCCDPCCRDNDNNWIFWIVIAIIVIFFIGGFGDNC